MIELIGVRFDGSGRPAGQSRAPVELRHAGLTARLARAVVGQDIDASAADSRRGPSGLLNERALLAMIKAVDARVRVAVEVGHFPLLYGADCAVLLGAVPALRAIRSPVGLLFIDAHEDATTMERSLTGEAANMEIALLLGLTGTQAPHELRRRVGALEPEALVMLGQRDSSYRNEIDAPSIANQVQLHGADTVHGHVDALAAAAVQHLTRHTAGWWLHVDLDVLRAQDFAACGAAHDPAMPGGLSWAELTTIARAALQARTCCGMSLGVYNTDLDPDRSAARDIVEFLAHVAQARRT